MIDYIKPATSSAVADLVKPAKLKRRNDLTLLRINKIAISHCNNEEKGKLENYNDGLCWHLEFSVKT